MCLLPFAVLGVANWIMHLLAVLCDSLEDCLLILTLSFSSCSKRLLASSYLLHHQQQQDNSSQD